MSVNIVYKHFLQKKPMNHSVERITTTEKRPINGTLNNSQLVYKGPDT